MNVAKYILLIYISIGLELIKVSLAPNVNHRRLPIFSKENFAIMSPNKFELKLLLDTKEALKSSRFISVRLSAR